ADQERNRHPLLPVHFLQTVSPASTRRHQSMNDLNVGLRVLRKSPGPSLFAVLALTLGIGLSVMMFSIIYGALHRGLPFEKPEQLVHLERARPSRGIESMEVTIHDFTDWRAQQRQSFVDLGAWYSGTVNVADGGVPERYDGAFITPSTFPLLGVRPLHGRLFREEETSRAEPMVVLIGFRMWQDRYEGDPGIVGRVIRVNGEPATIIGVMPEDFLFPFNHQIWVPLRLDPLTLKRGEGITLEVLGRLRDGVTIDRAMIEMTGITQRLAAEYPETNEGISPVIKPFTEECIGVDRALQHAARAAPAAPADAGAGERHAAHRPARSRDRRSRSTDRGRRVRPAEGAADRAHQHDRAELLRDVPGSIAGGSCVRRAGPDGCSAGRDREPVLRRPVLQRRLADRPAHSLRPAGRRTLGDDRGRRARHVRGRARLRPA